MKTQNRIAYLLDPQSKSKIINLKEIADAFASYYDSLYNLKKDPHIPQPQDVHIESFLASLQLATLTDT